MTEMKAKTELERLGKEARTEIDAYHGLLRRAGVHLFRAGEFLFKAKGMVREAGVTWAEWLRQEQIADSTARQAIDLYRNAKAMGHEEIDLEALSVTDAKVKYGVVAAKPKKVNEVAPTTPPPSSGEVVTSRTPSDQGDTPLTPPPDQGTKPPHAGEDTPPPAQRKGDTPPPSPKGHDARVKERSLLKLDEIFGEQAEERSISLTLATWRLLDILMRQEEVDDPSQTISRALREYWLRHGEPVQISRIPAVAHETEPQLVYSGVMA